MFKPSMPNVASAVMAWSRETRIFIVGKSQQDFKTIETYYEKTIKLVRIPSGQKLDMKHEGQRRWNSETIYAENDLDLKVDDIIIFECISSKRFRVINKTDYSDYGYVQYEILSDYARGFQ